MSVSASWHDLRKRKVFTELYFYDVSLRKWDKKKRSKSKNRKLLIRFFSFMIKETVAVVVDFLSNSSLHGIKYIAHKSAKLYERLFWTGVFVGTMVVSAFYIYKIWATSAASPIIISLDATGEDISLVPFPAVTICPVNKFSRRKWEILQKEKFYPADFTLEELSQLGEFFSSSKPFWSKEGHQALIRKYNNSDVTLNSLLRFFKKAIFEADDIVIYCQFQGGKYPCGEIFKPIEVDEAFCFSFNAQSLQTQLRDSDDEQREGKGLWKASAFQGLSVIVDLNNNDSVGVGKKMRTGLKVLVHDPLEIPDTTQHGFTVTGGQETYILVRLTKIESSSAVKGIAFEKRHCCFNQDRKLKYFKIYSRSLCFYDCFSSFLERNGSCGCKPFYRSVPRNLPYCDIGSYKCIHSLEVQLLEDDSLCGCCVECNSLVYEYLTSYAAFPGYGYSNAPLPFKIAAQKNDSKYTKSEYVRNNLARIQINWAQQKVFGRKRSVRFTWEDLVASIGGLLGFGTGFSLLSGFEIVYFLFIRLTIRLLYSSKS